MLDPIETRDLTIKEAAGLLGVSPRTVYRLVARGHIPVMGSRPYRVPRETVKILRDLWAAQRKNPFAKGAGRPRKAGGEHMKKTTIADTIRFFIDSVGRAEREQLAIPRAIQTWYAAGLRRQLCQLVLQQVGDIPDELAGYVRHFVYRIVEEAVKTAACYWRGRKRRLPPLDEEQLKALFVRGDTDLRGTFWALCYRRVAMGPPGANPPKRFRETNAHVDVLGELLVFLVPYMVREHVKRLSDRVSRCTG